MSYCEWPEFFTESLPVARKEHKCCECGLVIHRGQLYWRCTGKWDGDVSTHCQHIECRDACYSARGPSGDFDECIGFGELRDWLSEYGPSWEDNYKGDNVLRVKCETEVKVRRFLAAGIRASRLKSFKEYNEQHAERNAQ